MGREYQFRLLTYKGGCEFKSSQIIHPFRQTNERMVLQSTIFLVILPSDSKKMELQSFDSATKRMNTRRKERMLWFESIQFDLNVLAKTVHDEKKKENLCPLVLLYKHFT